jgi:hypothetical protein
VVALSKISTKLAEQKINRRADRMGRGKGGMETGEIRFFLVLLK